ncbi:MAG: neutral/alkaline non-lysosomal ceramidase N-terminal domain-containing protein [Pirellulaceae bacterium]
MSNIHAEPPRAGVAVEDITRDDPTRDVHDPLRAKALVVDGGDCRIVFVCLDITGASSTLVSDLRARLHAQLGFDASQVLINASHNHHTQGQVASDVVDRAVKAVRRASETMVPVKIGVGIGHEDRIMMNRRLRLEDGRAWTIRRANPSPKDAEITGLGPVDAEIGILRVDRLSGQSLAVLYNFAGHAYGGVPNGAVTADFPGFASAVLERALGHGAVALFLQGAAGDITPIRYKDVDTPPPTERLGTKLGLSTLEAVRRIPTQEAVTMDAISEIIELPRRQDVEQCIQSLEAEQDEILQFFTGVGCGTHGAGTFLNFKTFLPLYMKQLTDPEHPSYASYLYRHEAATGTRDLEHLDAQNKQRVDKYLACIHQMERLIRIRSNRKILQRHLTRDGGANIAAEVQGVRIGEFVLITFPGELFAEVALRIKHQSPCETTFVAAYSNGHLGYAPTTDAYGSQAYEDCLTPFAPEWQEIYEQKALEIIRRLMTSPRQTPISK